MTSLVQRITDLAGAVRDKLNTKAPLAGPVFTGTDSGANLTRSGTGTFGGLLTAQAGFTVSSGGIAVTGTSTLGSTTFSGNTQVTAALSTTGQLSTTSAVYANAPRTDTIYPGSGIGANLVGSSQYWAIRTATDNSFNLDVFNANSPKVALKVAQNGDATAGGALTVVGAVTFGAQAKLKSYTVGTLPAAAPAGAGALAAVSDASSPTYGATVAGGGSTFSKVTSDGTNWKVG